MAEIKKGPPTIADIDRAIKNRELYQKREIINPALQADYRNAVAAFLRELETPLSLSSVPKQLSNPLYFCYREGEKIYTVFPLLQEGTSANRSRITSETFPYYLQYVCGVPLGFQEKKAVNSLYTAFKNLILGTKKSSLDLARDRIMKYSPPAFWYVTYATQPYLYLSDAGNLVLDMRAAQTQLSQLLGWQVPLLGNTGSLVPFLEMLPIWNQHCIEHKKENPNSFPAPFFLPVVQEKSYFSKLVKSGLLPKLPKSRVPNRSILFRNGMNFFIASGDPEQSQCHLEDIQDEFGLSYGRKCLTVQPSHPITLKPNSHIEEFFRTACGGEPGKVREIQHFFTRIFQKRPGITVIYTKLHKDWLNQIIGILFRECLISPVSLNRLAAPSTLKQLFIAQEHGNSLILLKETLPNPKKFKQLRRLAVGKEFTIESDILPDQHFKNHMHLLCITDQKKLAIDCQENLGAKVIDLAAVEKDRTDIPSRLSCYLTPDEQQWLKFPFILHGLSHPAETPDTKSAQPRTVEDTVKQFLESSFTVQETAFTPANELLPDYQAFLKSNYPDCPGLELSQIKLNKKVKALIEHLPQFKEVRQTRNHCSRSEPSLWGYRGLQIRSEIPIIKKELLPEIPESIQQQRDSLSSLLLEISTTPI